MMNRHHRVSRLVAVAAAAASLAAPVTAVAESGDGQAGPTLADVFTDPAIVARHKALGRLGEPRRSNTILGNDIAHFGRSDTATVLRQSSAPIVVRVDAGFDWASAGVGAAGGLGLMLVVAATASALRRRQRVNAARA